MAGNLASGDTYKVVAIHPTTGERKVIAKAVGAFRAARLSNEIKRRGIKVEVLAVNVLKD